MNDNRKTLIFTFLNDAYAHRDMLWLFLTERFNESNTAELYDILISLTSKKALAEYLETNYIRHCICGKLLPCEKCVQRLLDDETLWNIDDERLPLLELFNYFFLTYRCSTMQMPSRYVNQLNFINNLKTASLKTKFDYTNNESCAVNAILAIIPPHVTIIKSKGCYVLKYGKRGFGKVGCSFVHPHYWVDLLKSGKFPAYTHVIVPPRILHNQTPIYVNAECEIVGKIKENDGFITSLDSDALRVFRIFIYGI